MSAAFFKDLRLLLRDRWSVLAAMLVPIAVITLISAALLAPGGGPRLSLAVVDQDRGPVAAGLKRALAAHAEVLELDRAEAERFVRERNRGPAAIVLPRGLSENHERGRPTEIPLLIDPAQEDGVRAAKVLLLVMEKQAAAENDPLSQQMIVLEERNLTGNRLAVSAFEQNLPGFALMFVLVAVIFSTSIGLHDERDWGTLPRLLMAPSSFAGLLLGKLGARFVVGVLQMLLLLGWTRVAFGVSLGSSPLALVALVCGVVLATVATGLLVAGVTVNREQVQPLGLALVVLLSGLGGLWWPSSMAPEWIQRVSALAYTTWAMHGINDLVLRDRGLHAVVGPLAALAFYATAALAVGLPLFRHRHRPH